EINPMYNNPALNIGDVLIRPKIAGFVDHVGIVVGAGLVLHNTPQNGEHIGTTQEFSAGQPVTVKQTGANPDAVVARAQQILANPKRYDAVFRNCQHTVTQTLFGIAKSPQ